MNITHSTWIDRSVPLRFWMAYALEVAFPLQEHDVTLQY